jgi:hypothetical protein
MRGILLSVRAGKTPINAKINDGHELVSIIR